MFDLIVHNSIVTFGYLYFGIIQSKFTFDGVGIFLSFAVLFVTLAEVIDPGYGASDSLHISS